MRLHDRADWILRAVPVAERAGTPSSTYGTTDRQRISEIRSGHIGLSGPPEDWVPPCPLQGVQYRAHRFSNIFRIIAMLSVPSAASPFALAG